MNRKWPEAIKTDTENHFGERTDLVSAGEKATSRRPMAVHIGAMGSLQLILSLLLIIFQAGDAGRLPRFMEPLQYRVTLLPILEENPRLCGQVWIDFVTLKDTNVLQLNGHNLQIYYAVIGPLPDDAPEPSADRFAVESMCMDGTGLWESDWNATEIPYVHANDELQLITLAVEERMPVGRRYRLGMIYSGRIQDSTDAHGFFRTSYTDDNCCPRWIGATQMEPTSARRVFPCVDEPEFKAKFQLTVGHRKNLKALANTAIIDTKPMKNTPNWMWTLFDVSPPMSTYIVAVAVTDFGYVERVYKTQRGRIAIRIWATERHLPRLTYAADLSPKVIQFLEKHLLVPYSLTKMDSVVIPGQLPFAAMENWGLIIFHEDYILHDTEESTKRIMQVLAHEWAHQWFGNLVTFKFWNDLLLGEGLTSYFENVIISNIIPDMDVDTNLLENTQTLMSEDFPRRSRTVICDVQEPQEIDGIFDSLTYQKGSLLFRMVKTFLGDKVFRSGIIRYLRTYQFQSVNASQLWQLLDDEASAVSSRSASDTYVEVRQITVEDIMNTWTHQEGYPLVHVKRSDDKSFITLAQEPFVPSDLPEQQVPKCVGQSDQPAWWVPVSLTNSRSLHQDITNPQITWIPPTSQVIRVPNPVSRDQWILANPQYAGYFRVNYDDDNWLLLADQLTRNHTAIPSITRAQLVEDSFVLAHSDVIHYDIPLKLINYLLDGAQEMEFIRKRVLQHLQLVIDMSGRPKLQSLMEETLSKLATASSRSNQISVRQNLHNIHSVAHWPVKESCFHGEVTCRSEALRLFQNLMDKSISRSDNKLLKEHEEIVWCTAIRFGDSNVWDFAWMKSLERSASGTANRWMLRSLACTRNAIHARKLMSRMFHPEVKQPVGDTRAIFEALADNPQVRSEQIHFIVNHFQRFVSKVGGKDTIQWLKSVARYSNSAEDLSKVESLLNAQGGSINVAESIRSVASAIRRNVQWSRAH